MAALALALRYGRTRAAPDLTIPIRDIFPEAVSTSPDNGIYHVYGADGRLLGWAGTGSASGYGGPMLLVTGVDTAGEIAGARVVEQRETPVFWRLVRARDLLESISGRRFDAVDYDNVDAVTGATISTTAVIASVRASVAQVAGAAFDVEMPLPSLPFEFGLLEITVLVLLTLGVVAHRARGTARRRLRWACQITGLVVIGFWKDSPITLAKLTALMSGFFPNPRTSLALYLLIAGFVATSLLYRRNVYCLYACPFGAAQRCVGVIGGKGFKLPRWSVLLMEGTRNLIVFIALFMALLTLRPALASYEPFAALFSLRGTTLHWLLLFLVLVASLALRSPWCHFFCPMRSFERVLVTLRRILRRPRPVASHD